MHFGEAKANANTRPRLSKALGCACLWQKDDAHASNRDPAALSGWRKRRRLYNLAPRADRERDDQLRSP